MPDQTKVYNCYGQKFKKKLRQEKNRKKPQRTPEET
jgi:hypothetical protein